MLESFVRGQTSCWVPSGNWKEKKNELQTFNEGIVVHRHEIKTPDIIRILDPIDQKIRFSLKTNAFDAFSPSKTNAFVNGFQGGVF